jgi:hypothetical protein
MNEDKMSKKLLSLFCVGFLLVGSVMAEGALRSDIDITLNWGTRFDSYYSFGLQTVFQNIRLGVGVDLQYKVSEVFALGAKTGLHFGTWWIDYRYSLFGTDFVSLIDIPLLAKVTFDLGQVEIQALGGALFNNIYDTVTNTQTRILLGAKVYLGNFELNGSYVFRGVPYNSIYLEQDSYFRVGLGFRIRLAQ